MEIGKKLKEARAQRKWTQEYVASQLQVSRSTISSWEVGRTYPDLESLVRLSDLYEISLDTLLREDRSMTKNLNKNIKKGRRLKWVVAALLLILVPLSFWAGQRVKNQKLTYLGPSTVTAAYVPSKLDSTKQIELTFNVPEGLRYSGYTEVIEDKVLYISLLANFDPQKSTDSNQVKVALSEHESSELAQLKTVVVVDGEFGSPNKGFNDFEQKQIWKAE
ncbi:helix-turn-helix domain-containing protein [Enterococcus diestrammenae]|uniref:helix-turn-helix domain-containing protein n=1 Tax=Enterococcus diestrammenae TaxID=1155073 RepID=UPI001958B861